MRTKRDVAIGRTKTLLSNVEPSPVELATQIAANLTEGSGLAVDNTQHLAELVLANYPVNGTTAALVPAPPGKQVFSLGPVDALIGLPTDIIRHA